MNETEKNEIIQRLIQECKWYFDNSSDYYSKETEFKNRELNVVKPMGLKVYEAGGMKLMREVYDKVEKECINQFGKNCRSALEMRWNGIGEWRG